ncbi:MAG: bifunctional aspartate kinase/homoserine dehydrogenase I [Treponema sp.]|jgi:aspartokinase/homoserine dehydrogenase 1|nr:bifunctional aspartate kinase/homoserine dehydrogenase I [Treponema sp.]
MLVLKFGGTSVGSPGAIGKIIEILKDTEHSGRVRAVVVSAFSGITDSLIDMSRRAAAGDKTYAVMADILRKRHLETGARFLKGEARKRAAGDIENTFAELTRILDGIAILGELSNRTLDYVMSFGERFSAALLAHIFTASGIDAAYLDARPLVKTDDFFGKANFLPGETFSNIRAFFKPRGGKNPPLQVVTGFIGSTAEGHTATLGRGGSDLSSAIFAAALGVKELEIWTDVDGILTADPKLVKNAFRIDELSYTEAMEISHFGARVLFPPTVKPALEKGIPIWIRNTFNPQGGGTRIRENAARGDYPIRGISSMNHVALVRIQGSGMVGVAGFSSRLFGALARRRINIILITQSSSEYSICFAVLPEDAPGAEDAIREEFDREIRSGAIEAPVSEKELSIIAVVGSRMKSTSGISGKVFHALGRNGINVVAIAQGSSELNISAVISRQDEGKALNAIHEAFFLSGVRSVNLFLLGAGLIGGTLLDQIAGHREILLDKHQIRINLVGAANSRNMIFRREGLDPKKVKLLLNGGVREETKPGPGKAGAGSSLKAEPFSLPLFIERMKAFNLPNMAFCDCTPSGDVSEFYRDILHSAISIVTPNKRANAGSLEYYRELTGYSRDRGIPYLYETTVCAGLPVISTLRDLALSGDRVRRIEAVLSGTLSFIFNNYDGSKPFSALVREARAKGYTEPDPRDDLNAMDAARKALILARECDMALEFSQVSIEPILPPSCFKAKDVEAFFTELEKSDGLFEKRRAAAAAEGKVLRYIAVVEEGSAKISLRAEAPGSPFLSLTDSDNIVVITTDRYSTLPMVIKGPGAGAQVTAGGIFADIVRIAKTLV